MVGIESGADRPAALDERGDRGEEAAQDGGSRGVIEAPCAGRPWRRRPAGRTRPACASCCERAPRSRRRRRRRRSAGRRRTRRRRGRSITSTPVTELERISSIPILSSAAIPPAADDHGVAESERRGAMRAAVARIILRDLERTPRAPMSLSRSRSRVGVRAARRATRRIEAAVGAGMARGLAILDRSAISGVAEPSAALPQGARLVPGLAVDLALADLEACSHGEGATTFALMRLRRARGDRLRRVEPDVHRHVQGARRVRDGGAAATCGGAAGGGVVGRQLSAALRDRTRGARGSRRSCFSRVARFTSSAAITSARACG